MVLLFNLHRCAAEVCLTAMQQDFQTLLVAILLGEARRLCLQASTARRLGLLLFFIL